MRDLVCVLRPYRATLYLSHIHSFWKTHGTGSSAPNTFPSRPDVRDGNNVKLIQIIWEDRLITLFKGRMKQTFTNVQKLKWNVLLHHSHS